MHETRVMLRAIMIQTLVQFFASTHTYAVALTILMALVILWDLRAYIIPNWINFMVLVLFAPAAFYLGLNPLEAGVAVTFMLAITMVLFALGIIGGGDAKLLTALTIWTGYDAASGTLLVYTAILGGVLVLMLWLLRRVMGIFWRKDLPTLFTRGAPIPYGVAIAGAFIILLWQSKVPSLPV